MIDKVIVDDDPAAMQFDLAAKINEIIDFLNAKEGTKLEAEIEKVRVRATHTGSAEDLGVYLALRRKRL